MAEEKEKLEELTSEEKKDLGSLEEKEIPEEQPIQNEIRFENIEGVKKSVDYVPTKVPINFGQQEVLYHSGTTYRLYKFIKDAWKKIYDSAVLSKSYVELAPITISKSQASADNWEDWNLSNDIPAGAYAVEVNVYHDTDETGGARENGSSADRYIGNPLGYTTFTTLLDSNRIIETFHTNGSSTRFWITGYWI